ncbi:MAG: hypothetical protein K940chlam3_00826 [Chlamydiae bacterium]|nr:hypothetical protein [Chlamydiota bacterium]
MTSTINTTDLMNEAKPAVVKAVITGVGAEGVNFALPVIGELLGRSFASGPIFMTGGIAAAMVLAREVALRLFNTIYANVPDSIKGQVPEFMKSEYAVKVYELATYAAFGAAIVQFGPAAGLALTVEEVVRIVLFTVAIKMIGCDYLIEDKLPS